MQKLSILEMEEVQGGVDWLTYCRTLVMIATHNTLSVGAQGGWNYGWNLHCAGKEEEIYSGME